MTAEDRLAARMRDVVGTSAPGVVLVVVGPEGVRAGFLNVMRMYPTEHVGAVVMGIATKYDVDAVARLALDCRG